MIYSRNTCCIGISLSITLILALHSATECSSETMFLDKSNCSKGRIIQMAVRACAVHRRSISSFKSTNNFGLADDDNSSAESESAKLLMGEILKDLKRKPSRRGILRTKRYGDQQFNAGPLKDLFSKCCSEDGCWTEDFYHLMESCD